MAYMVYMVCHDVDYGHGDDGWSIFGSKPTHRWPGLVTSTVHRGWLENPRNKWGFCYGKTIELWLIFQRCDWLLEDTGGTCHETLKHHLSIRGSILLRQPKKMPPNKDPLAWLTPVPPHRLGLLSHGEVEKHGGTPCCRILESLNHWKSGREKFTEDLSPAWNNAAGPSLGRNSRFSNWIWKSPGGTFTTDHVMFIIIFHVKTYCGWKKSCTSW